MVFSTIKPKSKNHLIPKKDIINELDEIKAARQRKKERSRYYNNSSVDRRLDYFVESITPVPGHYNTLEPELKFKYNQPTQVVPFNLSKSKRVDI